MLVTGTYFCVQEWWKCCACFCHWNLTMYTCFTNIISFISLMWYGYPLIRWSNHKACMQVWVDGWMDRWIFSSVLIEFFLWASSWFLGKIKTTIFVMYITKTLSYLKREKDHSCFTTPHSHCVCNERVRYLFSSRYVGREGGWERGAQLISQLIFRFINTWSIYVHRKAWIPTVKLSQ